MGLGGTAKVLLLLFRHGEAGWPWLATICLGLWAVDSKESKKVKSKK